MSQRAAEHSKQSGFDQHWTKHLRLTGAERCTNREFLSPGDGARQNEVGGVRARNE